MLGVEQRPGWGVHVLSCWVIVISPVGQPSLIANDMKVNAISEYPDYQFGEIPKWGVS